MTSKTISTNEKDYLLSLVKNRQQYRMGVIFPSRMNNYYSAAVSSCGNSRTACAALDDTDGDMTEIYGEHLLSVRGITGSVEPDKRKAGVWLCRAHKGFGERSFPSRTKYATPPAGRTAPATVYKCALVNKGLTACPRISAVLRPVLPPPEDGTGQSGTL